jgi:hypothetical protein
MCIIDSVLFFEFGFCYGMRFFLFSYSWGRCFWLFGLADGFSLLLLCCR